MFNSADDSDINKQTIPEMPTETHKEGFKKDQKVNIITLALLKAVLAKRILSWTVKSNASDSCQNRS